MNCQEARQHWNLYHDSEGDAELHFQIGDHLANCPQCAEWFHQQSRLEDLLVEKIAAQRPTSKVWDRVLARTELAKPAPTRRWILFGGVLACAASIVIAIVLLRHDTSGRQSRDLMAMTTAMHHRLIVGDEPLQFHSQSDLEVEDYLRHQVSFPVRCPPRKDAGFAVQGAGVCQFADQPAAYLAGHVDMTPVSIFVLPRDSLADFPQQEREATEGHIAQSGIGSVKSVLGVIDRNAVLVVGQTDTAKLERVLYAYGTYPDHPQ